MLKKTSLIILIGLAAFASYGRISAEAKNTSEAKDNIQAKDSKNQPQEIDTKKLSEAFGHFIGRNLKNPAINFDLEEIIIGMRNGATGKPAPMSDKDYEQMMAKMQEQALNKLSTTNLSAANEFLEKNAKEDKVIVIEPEKLQYMILQEGTGPVVVEHSNPQIQYVGKYLDGTIFGNSEETGGPITVPLDQTISGFRKGIVNMKEGEKRRLFIHPDLGYGQSGHLPPNSLLIFDITVIKANNEEKNEMGKTQRFPVGDLEDFMGTDEDFSDEEQDEDAEEIDNPKINKK